MFKSLLLTFAVVLSFSTNAKDVELDSMSADFGEAQTVKIPKDAETATLSLLFDTFSYSEVRTVTWPLWIASCVYRPAAHLIANDGEGNQTSRSIEFGSDFKVEPEMHYTVKIKFTVRSNCGYPFARFVMDVITPNGLAD